jgi:hypothetical protein
MFLGIVHLSHGVNLNTAAPPEALDEPNQGQRERSGRELGAPRRNLTPRDYLDFHLIPTQELS